MATLKKPKKVVLKPAEAHAIITWLLGKTSVKPNQFTKEDCGFAQVLLQEMLDASFAMGFVEALFRSAAKIPGGPVKVIAAIEDPNVITQILKHLSEREAHQSWPPARGPPGLFD